MSFVATIRRVPGGAFMKVPRSQNLPAVPVQTSVSNLLTYLQTWPRGKASFLLYGARRPMSSGISSAKGIADQASRLAHQMQHLGASGINGGSAAGKSTREEGGDEHLYGPKPIHAPPSHMQPATGGAGPSGQAAAAAKAAAAAARPLGLNGVLKRFKRGQKLAMITAYDFPSASLARRANVEIVLVGDSLGNCRLGLPDTVGVTIDDIARATTASRRGIDAPVPPGTSELGPKPILVGDMPFGSYLVEADGLRNAAALRIAGADVIKVEGGRHMAPMVRSFTAAGIPVMGHIGLLPQSASLQGGMRMQGTTASAAHELVRDAQELAAAGAVLLVVECVPAEVGALVQAALPNVPVIGIGAGGMVGGQVLVCDDLLGLHGSAPSFVKMYADLAATTLGAYASYVSDVRTGEFPSMAHARAMKSEELEKLRELVASDPELLEALAPKPGASDAALSGAAAQPSALPAAVDQAPSPPASATASAASAAASAASAAAAALSAAIRSKEEPARPISGTASAAGPFLQLLKPAPSRAAQQARAMSHVPSGASTASDGGAGKIRVLSGRAELGDWRRSVPGRVALVPTMGNLHDGHLELVDEALKRTDDVVVSIFVNPAQFAAHEDFGTYPRTFQRDLDLLQERGAAAVFAPTPADIYPSGSPGGTVVVPRFVEGKSEDACRPHFFTGVATVCLKLFNLCQPDVVVFGQKDAMQCVVIKRMLEDLCLDDRIEMVVAPTSREEDGLARSSRNSYLTPGMRQRAPAIYAALASATADARVPAGQVRAAIRSSVEAAGMEVSYVSVADAAEMAELADEAPIVNSVVSIACLLTEGDKQCRLIDNVVVPDV